MTPRGRPHLLTARPTALLAQGRADWFKIVNAGDGTATIYVYDEIGYWGVTASDFVTELYGMSGITTIDLRLNSPGGDVFDGLAIYHALANHPARVVATVDGLAASAASFILQAADERRMMRNGQAMIHEASGFAMGPASVMRDMADLLDRASANIADIYANRAGGDSTVASFRDLMLAETWYNADEAVAAGLADTVVQPGEGNGTGADAALTRRPSSAWDLSIFRYPGREFAPEPAARTQGNGPHLPRPELGLEPAPEPEPTNTIEPVHSGPSTVDSDNARHVARVLKEAFSRA